MSPFFHAHITITKIKTLKINMFTVILVLQCCNIFNLNASKVFIQSFVVDQKQNFILNVLMWLNPMIKFTIIVVSCVRSFSCGAN